MGRTEVAASGGMCPHPREAPCPPQVGLAGGRVTADQGIIDWSYCCGSDSAVPGFGFMFKSLLR